MFVNMLGHGSRGGWKQVWKQVFGNRLGHGPRGVWKQVWQQVFGNRLGRAGLAALVFRGSSVVRVGPGAAGRAQNLLGARRPKVAQGQKALGADNINMKYLVIRSDHIKIN